jgi:hypothetical protein
VTSGARTHRDAADPRLRGRTYHVPFEDVWQAARTLADGGLRGWTLLSADDQEGHIVASATARFGKVVDHVHIGVHLDRDAQTRVDVHSGPQEGGRRAFGRHRRRIGRFLKRLDREVPKAAARRREAARGVAPAAGGLAGGATAERRA